MKSLPQNQCPLHGIVVLDFGQFLSVPLATLKLADLGARVIKVERPDGGDLCRSLYVSNIDIDGDNSMFCAINRNKESITADLQNKEDREMLRALIAKSDVVAQNFRPGVMERHGFGYEDVRKINPSIVYGSISGYGEEGEWKDLPGQDLLAQARSGLLWLTGSQDDPPVPMGLAVADMLAGNALAQGILAALVGRGAHGRGAHVQTSLLEAAVDFQFEVLTTHLNDGNKPPKRSAVNGAHAYLGAPYGIYETANGHLALAMTPSLRALAELMRIDGLQAYFDDSHALMRNRDEIKSIMADAIRKKTTAEWLAILQPADVWCSEVLDWHALLAGEAWRALDFEHAVRREGGVEMKVLRGPVRINGCVLKSNQAPPKLAADQEKIRKEFLAYPFPTAEDLDKTKSE